MKPTVAYSGDQGSFSEEACCKFLPEREAIAKPCFAAVGEAVSGGETELGLLPWLNNVAGPVPGVAALIEQLGLRIVSLHALPVHLHLLAVPGTSLADLERIVSHPMALAQCTNWLRNAGIETRAADNTASAAKQLSQMGDGSYAVIASERAAELYGLQLLAQNIHDRPDNETMFAVVTNKRNSA